MSIRRLYVLLALATAVTLVTCTEVGTDPSAPIAIELDPPPLPALVIGDSMRDSTGQAVPLEARALNFRDDEIPDAPIRFLALDTGVIALDTLTGYVVGLDTGQVNVVATVGTLQSVLDTVRVTLRPDSLMVPPDSLRDSLQYRLTEDNVKPLHVTVGHDTTPAVVPGDPLVPVPFYLVRFAIVDPPLPSPGDSTQVQVVNDSRRASSADTTDATGVASRQLRLSPQVQPPIPDSVIVEVSVSRPDTSPVPGSPVRFTILLRPQ